MVHREKVGFGSWSARSAGGGWNGSWQDFHLSGSSNNMQIADWESCNWVAIVDYMGEYPWPVGEYGLEWLSWDYWWQTGVVSIVDTEFSAPLSFRDLVYSNAEVCSTSISRWNNPGCNNAWSCRDVEECHGWDGIWNWYHSDCLIRPGKCESHTAGSELRYWQAGKPMDYLLCVIWYLNIEIKTIK